MVLKIPPPQLLSGPQFEGFNRWLLELTAILTDQGNIDPSTVVGLPNAYVQIGDNSTDIITLFGIVTTQSAAINALNAALTAQVANLQAQINTLSARAQVFNGTGAPANALGSVGDWYANIGPPIGAAGSRIYIKTAAAVWTAFPF